MTRQAGALAYSTTDTSRAALQWRADPDVGRAWDVWRGAAWGSNSTYRHPDRRVVLWPGEGERSVALSELAAAFELGLGPVNTRKSIDAGIGVSWYGVHTQQSVTDSATLHELLWSIQPSLLIEIGTLCGGSAIFFARTMMGYNPGARVITIDRTSTASRRVACRSRARVPGPSGLDSDHWTSLVKSRSIIPMVGTPDHRVVLERVAQAVAESGGGGVFVIDDGDHLARPLLDHFAALSKFVSPGGYYVVQDTRLDTDCAYTMLTTRLAPGHWCRLVLTEGGAAAAVATLLRSHDFQQEWVQDRAAEKWTISQHPGGYLRRRRRRSSNAAGHVNGSR